ncbi:MAG TPA: hypothetical protein VK179_15780, partial [Bacteroidales bacterium]|nr:hypothetical protein [Bacteroidales bacterium]
MKIIVLLFFILLSISATCQIPVPRNRTFVQYDSMVSYFYGGDYDSLNSTKIIYTYDESSGKIKREQMYFWDQEKNSHYEAERKEFEYDEKGNTILKVVYYWNFFTNDWSGSAKDEHFYSDTLDSQIMYEKWNEKRKDFEGLYKMDWYKRADGKTLKFIFSMWDTLSHRWYYQSYNDQEYNETGLKITETGFIYDTSENTWNISSKSEWLYNQNKKDSINLSFNYNHETSEWVCVSKLEYNYADSAKTTNVYSRKTNSEEWNLYAKYEEIWDKKGNRILDRNLIWDSVTTSWEPTYQRTCSFDDLNRMTETVQWKWDQSTCDWLGEYKENHEFDDAGHRIHLNRYWWQDYGWELTSNVDSIYNEKGNLIISTNNSRFTNDEMFEYIYDENNILEKYNSYIGQELWTKGFYYWNKDITPTDTEIENKVSIYPNPFSTYLNISGIKGYAEIELIDLSG